LRESIRLRGEIERPHRIVRCDRESGREPCHHSANCHRVRANQAATLEPLRP
jgi:hypothetical protein